MRPTAPAALAAVLLALGLGLPASAQDAGPGDHRFTLRHAGADRAWRAHVPASYRPGQPVALLVALHGGGGNMDLQADDRLYGIAASSERHGFIAVFPNGFSRLPGGRLATWNAGRCCAGARDSGSDDVGFLRAVVAEAMRLWTVDADRVYATGMSNGAMMAYRLACEAPDLFRAVAAVAGTDNTLACQPSRPVAILHIHARDDRHVLFEGGRGPDAVAAAQVTDYTSVAATVDLWRSRNGCTAPAQRVLDRPGAQCDRWAPCAGGTAVQLCVTEQGGHSWPGGRRVRDGSAGSTALSANDAMWDFFSRLPATRAPAAPR